MTTPRVPKNKNKKKSSKETPPKTKNHIGSLLPLNLAEQKDLFFANGCKVNPQFVYASQSKISEYMSRFPVDDKYLPQAMNILNSCMAEFGTESNFMSTDGGPLLSEEETVNEFNKYVQSMYLEGKVSIIFSESAIAPTAVLHNPETQTSQLTVAMPIVHRQNRIRGVFHHEIGTHMVRTHNERLQVWYKKRKKYGLLPYIETEEGFASVNTILDGCFQEDRKPYLWRPALHYYASFLASEMSFVEIFEELEKFIDDPIVRFREVARVKRGLEDTGNIGGCYKDQVYLNGAIQVLSSHREIDFMTLISGKLALEDQFRPEIRRRAKTDDILMPLYLRDLPSYLGALDMIARINGICN